MRRLALALVAAIVALSAISVAAAQTEPEFKLGFKQLADMIPDIVGQPLENEHYAANGDSLQMTTRGLMVWRKADNWTAFTDGATTWINGPNGLQSRPNEMRFSWELQPAPSPTYGPVVKAMDLESGGPGAVVERLMREIDADWAPVWGWRSSKPLTVYLFTGGYHMVNGMSAITGRTLSADERRYYENSVSAFYTEDALTGGWAIVMNIANGMGTADWEAITKGTLVRQYAYVMMRDVAGYAGPNWYVEGFARMCSEAKVPTDPALRNELSWMYDARNRGSLPSLRRLHQDWAGYVSISSQSLAAANGYSYMAVRILADRVGGAPLLDILKRNSRGEDFEAAMAAVTGLNVDQLDQAVKAKL